jgi:cytoskeletal protein CcmA (bactofilin family)
MAYIEKRPDLCPTRTGGTGMQNGQSIVIKGEIAGNEDLAFAGRVEGRIRLEGRVLTLAPECHVVGEVIAGTVILAGKVEGNVEATERLEVRATSVVDGDLMAPALLVAEGALINGRVEMPGEREKRPMAVAV